MWGDNRAASKGMMSCHCIFVFTHAGTDSVETQRVRQAMLGCTPAHQLPKGVELLIHEDLC